MAVSVLSSRLLYEYFSHMMMELSGFKSTYSTRLRAWTRGNFAAQAAQLPQCLRRVALTRFSAERSNSYGVVSASLSACSQLPNTICRAINSPPPLTEPKR